MLLGLILTSDALHPDSLKNLQFSMPHLIDDDIVSPPLNLVLLFANLYQLSRNSAD